MEIATATHDHLGFAVLTRLPHDPNDKINMPIYRVIGDLSTCGGRGAHQADLRVDVKRKRSATRRPYYGGERNGVGDQVVAVHWALKVRVS
jgi:hypothetical protein